MALFIEHVYLIITYVEIVPSLHAIPLYRFFSLKRSMDTIFVIIKHINPLTLIIIAFNMSLHMYMTRTHAYHICYQ